MMKFFKTNTAIKIFSLLAAILVWVYVVQVENPEFETTIRSIPIVFENEHVLTDHNIMIVSDKKQTVDIRIQGRRQSISGLNADNVYAVVDLKEIQNAGDFNLPVQISFPVDNITVLERRPYSLPVRIEEVGNIQKDIVVDITGSPKSGYFALPTITDQQNVTVSGPESLLKTVSSVKAKIDIDGHKEETAADAKLIAYDKDGREIKSDLLVFSHDSVHITCPIVPVKTVDIKFDVTGTPANADYVLKNVYASPDKIKIAGQQSLLDLVSLINIGTIDLSTVTPYDNKRIFPVTLSEGLVSADGIENVEIVAEFNMLSKKTITLDSFEAVNLPLSLKSRITTQSIDVTVSGSEADLEGLTKDDFTVSVDMKGYVSGKYMVKATITPKKGGVKVEGEYELEVIVES